MISSEDFENFRNINQEKLVGMLKEPENSLAWEYIYHSAVLSVLKGKKDSKGRYVRNNFFSILQDKGIDARMILSDLYEEMILKKKIDNFKYKSSLVHWLKIYVRMLIRKYCKKNPQEVSENVLEFVYIDDRHQSECVEICRMSFSELWKENPMRAYVLMLKGQKYSSTEICDMLGLASSNYVDQVYLRAKSDMAVQVKKFAGGEI